MRISLLAAGLFGALACASIANAQTAEAPAASAPASGGYSDDDLKAFGQAMTDIQKVNQEYQPKMAGADGPTKDALQKEMIGKMGEAVSSSGLSPQKYNEISGAVQKDAALRQRLTTVLNPPA